MSDTELGRRLLTQLIDQVNNQDEQAAIDFYNSLTEYEKESIKISFANTIDELTKEFDKLSRVVRSVQRNIEKLGDVQFRLEQMLEQEGGDEN